MLSIELLSIVDILVVATLESRNYGEEEGENFEPHSVSPIGLEAEITNSTVLCFINRRKESSRMRASLIALKSVSCKPRKTS